MKKFKLIVIAFVFSSCTIAQPNTFEKIIDTLGCDYASCIKETFDGGYIIAGSSWYINNDVAIIKLDSLGKIEWAKTYDGGGMDGALRIEQFPDSGYMVMGVWNGGLTQKTWLLRLDKYGDTLWTSQITGGFYKNVPQSMILRKADAICIVGYFYIQGLNNDAYLLATDSLGAIVFYKEFGDTIFSQGVFDIQKCYGNEFALVGLNQININKSGVYLFKVNSIGDTIWFRTYFNSRINVGYSIKQTADSGFIIAGITIDSISGIANAYIIKTNSNGDTVFTKVYKHSKESTARSLVIVDSTGYIFTGRIINPLPQLAGNLLLIRTNEYGDTLWTRWYAGLGSAQGNYVVTTKDKGFICTGNTGSAMYIIKTDSLGLVYTSSGINDVVAKPDMVIYPNPSDGLFYMKVNNIYSSFTVTVSNAMGNTIKRENIHSCDDYCLLDLSAYSNGLYTVTVQSERKSVSKKVVVSK